MKMLSQLNIEEVACRQFGMQTVSGALAFARKDDDREKQWARNQILQLFTPQRWPGPLRILSMPSFMWTFEWELIKQRETDYRRLAGVRPHGVVHRTFIDGIENDRSIFMSFTTHMPGSRQLIQHHRPPRWAEKSMGTSLVPCFLFANVFDLMNDGAYAYDAAWLDFTGPPSIARVEAIAKFYRRAIRKTLIVTFLKARWEPRVSKEIRLAGSVERWLSSKFSGKVLHCIEYQDGASPMIQIAIEKPQ